MTTDRYIPPWLRELLLAKPQKGGGLHQWVFRCVKALKSYMPESEIPALMEEVSQGADRDLTREIGQALKYSRGYGDDVPVTPENDGPRPVFPARAEPLLAACHPVGLDRLEEMSPMKFPGVEESIDMLFPGNPLLCFATAPWSCAVRERNRWRGRVGQHPFMVPSAMTAFTGMNKSGRESARCLGNTGPKMYQVVEFDEKLAPGSLEQQAGRIMRLAKILRPAVILHSGGKSLHAWFPVWHLDGESQVQFFGAACLLGADPATWLRCQLVRVPGSLRSAGVVQKCLYIDPDAFPTRP